MGRAEPWGVALAVTGSTLAVGFGLSGSFLRHRSIRSAWIMAVIGTVAFHMVVGFRLLPSREPQRLSPRVASAINEMTQPGDTIYLCGYAEPTLHYYLNEKARDIHRRDLEIELASAHNSILLAITQRSIDRLNDPLRALLLPRVSERSVSGINEANMRTVTVHVGRLTPDVLANLRSLR